MCLPKKTIRNERGFTFVEILVSLVIISFIGMILFTGASRAQTVLKNISEMSITNNRLLQYTNYLRSSAAQVKVPFWIREISFVEKEDSLEIPYFRGEKDSYLVIGRTDHFLTIDSRNSPVERPLQTFGPFHSINFHPMVDENGSTSSIKTIVELDDGPKTQITVIARFGTFPISFSAEYE